MGGEGAGSDGGSVSGAGGPGRKAGGAGTAGENPVGRPVDLTPGAKRLVHVNGRVQPGEQVVVVTDPTMGRYADAVAAAAREAGAAVTVCVIPLRDQDGQEPPPPAARAMAEAAVIFSPVRISITHTRAMRTALEAGARVCMMTAYTDAIMTSPALLETDFEAQADVCRRLGAAFTAGASVGSAPPAAPISASASRAAPPTC